MRKNYFSTILASAFLTALIAAPTALAAPTVAEDVHPKNPMFTLEFSLNGKIKNLVDKYIQQLASSAANEISSETEVAKPAEAAIKEIFLSGGRFFISFVSPMTVTGSFPVTDAQWETLMKEYESYDYKDKKIYQLTGAFGVKLGDIAVITGDMNSIEKAVDMAETASSDALSADSEYKEFTSDFLKNPVLGFVLDFKQIAGMLPGLAGQVSHCKGRNCAAQKKQQKDEVKMVNDLLAMFNFEGFTFADSPTGYKFQIKITTDMEKGLTLNGGGNFTPNLYKKFPPFKPILYSESFNLKGNYAKSKESMKMFQAKSLDLGALSMQQIGMNLEDFYNVFDQEFGFAIQENGVVPYFTVMGNVANSKDAAKKLSEDVVKLTKKLLIKNHVRRLAWLIKQSGDFTYLTLDLSQIGKKGSPFPKTTFVIGVTEDNLFIVSNYPGIENAAGRSENSGLVLRSPEEIAAATNQISSLGYLNFRNLWEFVDGLFAYTEKAKKGKFSANASTYSEYDKFLDAVYGFKDILLITKGSDHTSIGNGDIVFDDAVHTPITAK